MGKKPHTILKHLDNIETAIAEIRALAADGKADDGLAQTKEDVDSRVKNQAGGPYETSVWPDQALVKQHLDHRRELMKTFGPELVADPVWTMLLDLLLARYSKTKVCVTSLCLASGVPSTTALRWIAELEARGLVERAHDPSDLRRINLDLTKNGLAKMLDHLQPL